VSYRAQTVDGNKLERFTIISNLRGGPAPSADKVDTVAALVRKDAGLESDSRHPMEVMENDG
jgi:hypothetical protein